MSTSPTSTEEKTGSAILSLTKQAAALSSSQADNSDDYTESKTLIGAHPFSSVNVYTNSSKDTIGQPDDNQQRQLEKTSIGGYDDIVPVLREYAKDSPKWCEWTSDTLPEDLCLPITTSPPCKIVQVFLLGVDLPLLLLTVFEDPSLEKDARLYTKQTVSALRWRLLEVCHVDFLLLPCIVTKNFDLATLKKEVEEQLTKMACCFGGITHLDTHTFETMKEATTALAGSTSIPCHGKLCKRAVYVMEKKWRDLLSLLIELLSKQQRQLEGGALWVNSIPLEIKDDAKFKVIVAVLEAVKRLTTQYSFHITSTEKELMKVLGQQMEVTKKKYDVGLKEISTKVEKDPVPETIVVETSTGDKKHRMLIIKKSRPPEKVAAGKRHTFTFFHPRVSRPNADPDLELSPRRVPGNQKPHESSALREQQRAAQKEAEKGFPKQLRSRLQAIEARKNYLGQSQYLRPSYTFESLDSSLSKEEEERDNQRQLKERMKRSAYNFGSLYSSLSEEDRLQRLRDNQRQLKEEHKERMKRSAYNFGSLYSSLSEEEEEHDYQRQLIEKHQERMKSLQEARARGDSQHTESSSLTTASLLSASQRLADPASLVPYTLKTSSFQSDSLTLPSHTLEDSKAGPSLNLERDWATRAGEKENADDVLRQAQQYNLKLMAAIQRQSAEAFSFIRTDIQ